MCSGGGLKAFTGGGGTTAGALGGEVAKEGEKRLEAKVLSTSLDKAKIPTVLDPQSEEVTKARSQAVEDESKRARLRGGRESTILTGPLGVTGQANVARKTLLGS